MKSCHYGSSCGHKQGKSVLSYPPGKHANLKTDFTAQLCGKTRLDATHFVQPPSCPKPTSTPTFPHHNNEKSKKMPHFLSFNPRFQYLKYTQGNCMRNYRDAVRTRTIPRPGPTGVDGAGGSGGPGCDARNTRGVTSNNPTEQKPQTPKDLRFHRARGGS